MKNSSHLYFITIANINASPPVLPAK